MKRLSPEEVDKYTDDFIKIFEEDQRSPYYDVHKKINAKALIESLRYFLDHIKQFKRSKNKRHSVFGKSLADSIDIFVNLDHIELSVSFSRDFLFKPIIPMPENLKPSLRDARESP
jgi:hypothetical protein